MARRRAGRDIELTQEARSAIRGRLQTLFRTEFDETLSDFRADEIVELLLGAIGPTVYNQAVQDVRAHLQGKLDDLDGEIYLD